MGATYTEADLSMKLSRNSKVTSGMIQMLHRGDDEHLPRMPLKSFGTHSSFVTKRLSARGSMLASMRWISSMCCVVAFSSA